MDLRWLLVASCTVLVLLQLVPAGLTDDSFETKDKTKAAETEEVTESGQQARRPGPRRNGHRHGHHGLPRIFGHDGIFGHSRHRNRPHHGHPRPRPRHHQDYHDNDSMDREEGGLFRFGFGEAYDESTEKVTNKTATTPSPKKKDE